MKRIANLMMLMGNYYLFRDMFFIDVTGGAIDNSRAVPGVGTRGIINDTESTVSVESGNLVFNKISTSTYRYPTFYENYPIVRERGKQVIIKLASQPANLGTVRICLSADKVNAMYVFLLGAGYVIGWNYFPMVYDYSTSNIVFILRDSGYFGFIQIGNHMILQHEHSLLTTTPVYALLLGQSKNLLIDEINVPKKLDIPIPICSDGFGGTWGTSDGLGHQESVGLGAGGDSVSWVDITGTFTNTAGVAKGTLDGGVALSLVTLDTSHVELNCTFALTGGVQRVYFRYIDANNFGYAEYNGTTVTLHKVIAGSDTQLATGNFTADVEFKLFCQFDRIAAYYGGVQVGSTAFYSVPELVTGKKFGIYTTDADNTFDNFVVWAAGVEGQNDSLFSSVITLAQKTIFAYGDSKIEAAADNYEGFLPKMGSLYMEYPNRVGISGQRADTAAIALATQMPDTEDVPGTPDYVLINLGRNDAGAGISETLFKDSMGTILDYIIAQYPLTKIYIQLVWDRVYADECDVVDGWITDIIALRSDYCFVGPDERIYLENGDNGTTYTDDGTHPNSAGYQVMADQWREVLGL